MNQIEREHDALAALIGAGWRSYAEATVASWDRYCGIITPLLLKHGHARAAVPLRYVEWPGPRDIDFGKPGAPYACDFRREPMTVKGAKWWRVLGSLPPSCDWIEVERFPAE